MQTDRCRFFSLKFLSINQALFQASVWWLSLLPLSHVYSQPKLNRLSETIDNSAQQASSRDTSKALSDCVFLQEPQFPGGNAALQSYLHRELRYPLAARRAKVEGRVFVSFVINADGTLSAVQILKGGLGYGTDEEAVRLVAAMPRWKPATQSGKAMRLRYHLPITFKLD